MSNPTSKEESVLVPKRILRAVLKFTAHGSSKVDPYMLIQSIEEYLASPAHSETPCDEIEQRARDHFNAMHRIDPRDIWALQPEATRESYREWVRSHPKTPADSARINAEQFPEGSL